MSISSETALEMVDKKMEREAKSAQPDEAKPEIEQTVTPDPEPEKEKPEEEAETEKKGDTPEPSDGKSDKESTEKSEKKLPPSKRYSSQERMNHAFAKEKEKRRKVQEENKMLREQLKKYEGLKLDDFGGNVDDYTNWKLEERDMQNQVKRNEEYLQESENRALAEETQRRIDLSFDTDEEKEEYRELLRKGGKEFYDCLKKYDPENVVLTFLNRKEKYPKVLKELLDLNTGALQFVFQDPDPDEIHDNLKVLYKRIVNGEPPTQTNSTPAPKTEAKPLPVIGKQVTAAAKASEPVHDRAYWNAYLKQHPHG